MNVLIMGDSWGKSELEYYFLKRKHTVFNKAIFGGSNYDSLNDSLNFLNYTIEFIKIDLIIWFQTEYIRELNILTDLTTGYKNTLDLIHEKISIKIAEIREITPNSKWVIIGGHAPIYDPDSYRWADVLIEDWRSELVGQKLPFCHAISHNILSKHVKEFGLDVLEEELKKYEIILNAVLNKPNLFHDGVHPTTSCHEDLYQQLANKLNFI